MSEEPNIEFEGKGLSLKLTGLKPLSQITQYAADAVGIIGEPLGIVKDKLATFRLNQAESAAVALQRARQIREERGEDIQPVSQKYLANWIEGASNEDATSDNILELWAILLAGAGSEFDAMFLAYNDALRKIGPVEAQAINRIVQPRFMDGIEANTDGKVYRWTDKEICEKNSNEIIDFYLKHFKTADINFSFSNHKKLRRCANILSMLLDGFVVSINVKYESGGFGIGGNEGVGDILEHAGLVSIYKKEAENFEGQRLEVTWAVPTKIGLALYLEINKDRLSIDVKEFSQAEAPHYLTVRDRIPRSLMNILEKKY